MQNAKGFHLLISLCVLLSSFTTLTLSERCHPYDKKILLELKAQLGNPPSLAQTWNTKTDCCSEWGSQIDLCDEDGHVTRLILGLFEQDISGPLPPVISQLKFLRSLELLREFSGPIPLAICNLTKLNSFVIQDTNMSGPIPDCLGRLTNLTSLRIIFNPQITGPIPSSIGKLTKLVSIELQRNQLSGPLPDSFHHMTSLETFSIDSNRVSGPIPASLGLAPKLSGIYFGNNTMSGSIAESLGSLKSKNPVTIDLGRNQLSGSIPKSLGNANIVNIDLSSNRFTGEPSFVFGRNKKFETVNLSKNRFKFDFSKAELPKGIKNLDVSHNMIYGSLPRQLGQLPLYHIDVSYNQLCGLIPTGRRLKKFDPALFSHNKCLCGRPLPPCE